jgi:hypothetical protein
VRRTRGSTTLAESAPDVRRSVKMTVETATRVVSASAGAVGRRVLVRVMVTFTVSILVSS